MNLNERQDSDFYFLSNLLSDVSHALICNGLQPTTIFQYYKGYSCESILVWSPTTMRDQVLISYFLLNLSSDERHVRFCSGLQSATVYFQYCRGHNGESILCGVRPQQIPDSDFLFPILLRWTICSERHCPSINRYLLSILPSLHL